VRHGCGIGKIIDGYHFYIGTVHCRSEYQSSNSTETIYPQLDAHKKPPSKDYQRLSEYQSIGSRAEAKSFRSLSLR
jgi:hypothetical protein